jgi:hypothetical protein
MIKNYKIMFLIRILEDTSKYQLINRTINRTIFDFINLINIYKSLIHLI